MRSRQGETKPFFPWWGIQHSTQACSMQSSRQVQQNFSTGWDTHNSSPVPHPSNRETCWSTTEYKRAGEDKAKQSVFGCSSSQDARNVKCFPRKFLHLQEEREGNQENFWHILGRESEHDSKESEDADWSTASKVCEQHSEAWSQKIFPKPYMHIFWKRSYKTGCTREHN